jgi:DNA polymerase-3 subunit alpha
VHVRAALEGGGEARLVLGRDFLLDHELAARIEAMQGIVAVALRPVETRPLALVG